MTEYMLSKVCYAAEHDFPDPSRPRHEECAGGTCACGCHNGDSAWCPCGRVIRPVAEYSAHIDAGRCSFYDEDGQPRDTRGACACECDKVHNTAEVTTVSREELLARREALLVELEGIDFLLGN